MIVFRIGAQYLAHVYSASGYPALDLRDRLADARTFADMKAAMSYVQGLDYQRRKYLLDHGVSCVEMTEKRFNIDKEKT